MEEGTMNVEVIWRGTKLNVEVNSRWTARELGKKLLELTSVNPDTLKLLVPQTNGKGSRLLAPFSVDNSSLYIQETGIIKGKPVRMMGAFDDEINEVSQNNMKPDLRIAGFEEEEKRLRQLSSYKPQASLKLPEGPYIFCDFHTLEVPGIELNPPPSKALRIMHILVCDPGIIAIMNKHRWRVGIMTELAPVGYVGISPKCILGFNKNHGEEISLRLRTDDLKGFRKYESIKKTLLHELAHMVYSEHDANFLALEKQLNKEDASLDWTKSRSRTFSGREVSNHYEVDSDYLLDAIDVGRKLGGGSNLFATARASSVAAASHRYLSSSEFAHVNAVHESLDNEHDSDKPLVGTQKESHLVPETNDSVITQSHINDLIKIEPEPDGYVIARLTNDMDIHSGSRSEEPDSNNEYEVVSLDQDSNSSLDMGLVKAEPDADDHMSDSDKIELQRIEEPMAAIYARIQESIKLLRSELNPPMAASVLQTLSKIISNVLEHPDELKFRRIKKANAQFQRNVANYKAAMEVLKSVGFSEDVLDEAGEAETYLVLKRNDPGLLWLAKSSLELFVA